MNFTGTGEAGVKSHCLTPILFIWFRKSIYPPVFYRDLMPTNPVKSRSLWKRNKLGAVTEGKAPSNMKKLLSLANIPLLLSFPFKEENTTYFVRRERFR